MKSVLLLTLLTLSFNVLATDCKQDVLRKFILDTPEYDFHTVSGDATVYSAGTKGFESFGRYIELGYTFDVITYRASNEFQSGLGIYEIIVNPTNCKTLKTKEVYTE